jgi:hypothetical protein
MSFSSSIIDNHKVCNLRTLATQTVGTANQLAVDLQEANTTTGIRERSTELMVIVTVTDINSSSLIVVGIDAVPGSTEFDLDYATATTITANGIYIFEIKNIKGEFKLRSTVGASVVWGAIGVSFNPQRRPVVQTDATELDITYGTTVPVSSSSPSVSASVSASRSASVSASVSSSVSASVSASSSTSPSVSASVSASSSTSPSVSASVSSSVSASRSASVSASVSASSSASA